MTDSNWIDMHKQKFFSIILLLFFLIQSCEKEKKKVDLPTDGDGNTYDTIVLGTQVWLTENLKTTKYNNGDPIPFVEEDERWSTLNRGAYCWYQNNPNNKDIYGAVYNWYAAQLKDFICPVGYHVPTKEEWQNLIDFLNNSSNDVEVKFKAIGTGWRAWDGSFSYSHYGVWWMHSPDGSDYFVNNGWGISTMPKNSGFSIRCIKN